MILSPWYFVQNIPFCVIYRQYNCIVWFCSELSQISSFFPSYNAVLCLYSQSENDRFKKKACFLSSAAKWTFVMATIFTIKNQPFYICIQSVNIFVWPLCFRKTFYREILTRHMISVDNIEIHRMITCLFFKPGFWQRHWNPRSFLWINLFFLDNSLNNKKGYFLWNSL